MSCTHATEWNHPLELLSECIGFFPGGELRIDDRRLNRAGANDIGTNALWTEFRCPGANEVADRRLSRAVGTVDRHPFGAHHTPDDNDRSPGIKQQKRLLHCRERAAGIDVEGLVVVLGRNVWWQTSLLPRHSRRAHIDAALL